MHGLFILAPGPDLVDWNTPRTFLTRTNHSPCAFAYKICLCPHEIINKLHFLSGLDRMRTEREAYLNMQVNVFTHFQCWSLERPHVSRIGTEQHLLFLNNHISPALRLSSVKV